MRLTQLYSVARQIRLPDLMRRVNTGAVILCYHNVVSPSTQHRGSPPMDLATHMDLPRFERQMRWVRDHLEVVPLPEVVTRLDRGLHVRNLAALTFDDGYRGFFHRALPVLRDLGLPSTVFLVSRACEHGMPFWWDHPHIVQNSSPERRHSWLMGAQGDAATILQRERLQPAARLHEDLMPATWDIIHRCSGSDVTIAGHTLQHRCLPALSEGELREELEDGLKLMTDRIADVMPWLAYPYGAWDERVANAARVAGYDVCFSLDRGSVSCRRYAPLAVPRIGIPGSIPDDAFEAWVSGLYPPQLTRRRLGAAARGP